MIRNVLLFCLLISISISPLLGQQTVTGSIFHDGLLRNYRLYIPSTYSSNQPAPLVFNLHGYTSNALEQEFYSDMNGVADTAGFLVCYPDGIGNAWNVGWAAGSPADDVGFLSALIDTLAANYAVNVGKVYSCGMSNGGFMSYRLACELNDKIAAVASVTGSLVPESINTCVPNAAVPVLQMHGNNDLVVNYNGTPGISRPIDETIQFWVDNNGCMQGPDTTQIPDSYPTDGSTAFRVDYSNCTDDAKVSLIVLENGEHTWPGALLTIGVTNRDIHGSEEIWLFFKQYGAEITSVEETILTNGFSVYPNPTADFFQVEYPAETKVYGYEMYTLNGQQVISGSMPSHGRISVQGMASGLYLVRIKTEQGVYQQKVSVL